MFFVQTDTEQYNKFVYLSWYNPLPNASGFRQSNGRQVMAKGFDGLCFKVEELRYGLQRMWRL